MERFRVLKGFERKRVRRRRKKERKKGGQLVRNKPHSNNRLHLHHLDIKRVRRVRCREPSSYARLLLLLVVLFHREWLSKGCKKNG
jgi:hypothetical protein